MNALNDIILGCINGNNLMQRELYNIYSPRFNALCHRYISNDDIAQDIFIDGFATVFNTMNQYRGEGSLKVGCIVFLWGVSSIITETRKNMNIPV